MNILVLSFPSRRIMPSNSMPQQVSAWILDDLFPSANVSAMAEVENELDQHTVAFEEWRQHLSPDISIDSFLQIIQALEGIHKAFDRIYGYHGLRFYADTQD